MPTGFLYRKIAGRELGVWFFVLVFPALFLAAGVTFLGPYWRERAIARAAETWSPTAATVERVRTSSRRAFKNRFDVRVIYRYEIGGRVYRSSWLRTSLGRADVRLIAQRYRDGAAVTAYVNPLDASQSVLERGMHPGRWVIAALGAVFTVVSIAISRFVFRSSS